MALATLARARGALGEPLGPAGSGGARYTFAHHLTKTMAYGCIMLGIALAMTVIAPPGEAPAPVSGIEVTKPPWLLLPLGRPASIMAPCAGLTSAQSAPARRPGPLQDTST